MVWNSFCYMTTVANISRPGFDLRILGCARYFVHRLHWYRKNHQKQILYSIIGAVEGRNRQKTATNKEEKSALSLSRVDRNDCKPTWIALRIASAPTLYSRSGPQRLLAAYRPQKNALGKEIWFPWRNDIGNCHVFWGQRQIVLQKRHRVVWEALKSVYHPKRRLCWWIRSNFT